MMLDLDGVLTKYGASSTDLLAVAQAVATSAIGDLVNKGASPESLHRFADLAAEQIRETLHKRIDEGPKPDW